MKCLLYLVFSSIVSSALANNEIEVPLRDSRGIGEDAIQAGAAALSIESIVIVFFGNDAKAYIAVVSAARDIIAEGEIPLRGLILADPLETVYSNGYLISGRQEVEIYVDGQLTNTIELPRRDLEKLVKDTLREDHRNIIIPRLGKAPE